MARLIRSLLVSSLAVLALAASAAAAPPVGGSVHEQAGVSLVEVPVTVTDRDGKPVKGLTAADFEVRDDGKEVTIQAVDVTEILSGKPAPGAPRAGAAVSPAARRRFLLLFDLSFATPSRITRIREAARKFVMDQIGPDDLAAVATYSVEHGMKLVLTFTPDRAQLASAVETLGFVNDSEKSPDPLQLTSTVPLEWVMGQPPASSTGRRADVDLENLRDVGRMAQRQDDAYRRGRVGQLIQSFGSLARALDSVEGRKQVIYFSQGFDIRLLQGNSQDTAATTEQNENAAHGAIWSIDSEARFGNSGLQSALNDMLDLFKRSDCVVHAVDLSGLTAGNEQGGADPSGGSGQAALFAIAEGTGGELFKNANDFSGQLDKLLEEESVVYVLTFSPKLSDHPGKYHSLRVRVKRSGARVSARAGYYEPRPFKTASTAERNLTAADVIASEIPVDGIPLAVQSQAFAGQRIPEAMVQIQVPASRLAPPGKTGKLPLEIYVYAFDSAGKVADFSTEKATLDLAQVRSRLESGGLRFFAQLALAPGSYRLRSLVRDSETGAMGFSAADLVVPDFADKKPHLVPPLAVGGGGGLVLRGKSARSGEAQSFPFMVGGDPFLPDAHPAVAKNDQLKLCLYAYGFGEAGQLRIGGQLLDASGKPTGTADIALLGRSAPDVLGRTTYLLGFKPGSLAAGSYQLRVMVEDPSSGAARQATTPVEVR
jgi:VWFA-related protein